MEFSLASATLWLSDARVNSALAYAIVLVTAPSLKVARTLAKAVLKARLAACANLVPSVESHYWWQGKMESSKEVMLVMKTERAKLSALETLLLRIHPYDTPEILALALHSGTGRYLGWLANSLERPQHS